MAITPRITPDDVIAAVAEVTAMYLPDPADQAVCANETWANRVDTFPKAFDKALKDLGVDTAIVQRLVKQFQAALPEASRMREKREEDAKRAAEKATEDAEKAAKEAREDADKEKEAIKSIAEGSRHHRDGIKRLYDEANEAVEDLSDDGISAPKHIKDLLAEMKVLSDGARTAWEDIRDGADRHSAEQRAKDLEISFNDATEKSKKVTVWVDRQKSVEEIVEKVRESRKQTQGLFDSAVRKAKPAQQAFAEADVLERPRSLILRPVPEEPAKTALKGASQELTDLLAEIEAANTDADSALSRAEAILGRARPNRKDARAALKDAKAAEEEAKTGEGKVEASAATVVAAADHWKEEVKKKDTLLSKWWVRASLVVAIFLLVLVVLPNPYKAVLGLAAVPVAAVVVAPLTWRSRLGEAALWAYGGAVALLIGIIMVVPFIQSAPGGVGGVLPGSSSPTEEPTPVPTVVRTFVPVPTLPVEAPEPTETPES